MAIVYALLLAGALTTLYPFLLMAATGLKGPTDQDDGRLIPKYLVDDEELGRKYLDDKYAGNLSLIASSRIGAKAGAEEVSRYERFLMELPPTHWHAGFRTPSNGITSRLTERYRAWLRDRFGGKIDALNAAYLEENVAFQTVSPPNELLDRKGWTPPRGRKWEDWLVFKQTLPSEFRIPLRGERLYQEWLRVTFANQIGLVPPEVTGGAKSFEEILMPDASPWRDRFLREALPATFEGQVLEERWGSSPMPIVAHEAASVRSDPLAHRTEFATRNARFVVDYVALHGRALLNTLIFCGLAILTQLIVNPLAAYALSRYPMRFSAQVLVFLLATMAFPAEVALIPSFLLLKDLGLLNTFAALVLPTAASGFTIFLLKGFFDSLPKELFESGQIDGAKELTMMMRIALPLSKPVLGYLALLAFMGAYGAFMYAFLVAQDQRMWTLSVWLYQLQLSAPKATTMAALTVAALPTLIVFLLAQRVIMRGIVLPGER